jgi:hypothetical protein
LIGVIEDGRVRAISLPPVAAGKKHKMDLEACVAHEGRLVAFGSGSTAAREKIVIETAVHHAPALYAALRASPFAGSELNLEGATLAGDDLTLFQRGNGAGDAVNATCVLSMRALLAHLQGGPVPELRDIRFYDLGTVAGVRLTFTDAAGDFYLAAAEASPNTYDDGVVVGTAIGRIDQGRYALLTLLTGDGQPFTSKVEGLMVEGDRALVVVDKDDPEVPSELCEVVLHFP